MEKGTPSTKRPRLSPNPSSQMSDRNSDLPSIPFTYDDLEDPASDIRLIEIESLHSGFLICYIMHTYKAEDCPTYEALSYVWGDDLQKMPIYLRKSENLFRELHVTRNLHSALQNLHKRQAGQSVNGRLFVWIDALCINQQNVEERNQQVQRMTSIYQNARRVIVYLGDYDAPTDEAVIFSPEIWGLGSVGKGTYLLTLAAFTIAFQLFSANRNASAEEVEQWLALESLLGPRGPISDIHAWAHLCRLFNRPWFERLWIIQELGVSREAIVLCGNIEIPWSTIEGAAAFILRPHVATPARIRRFLPLMGAHRVTQVALNSVSGVDMQNLLSILRQTRKSKCSDPRDRLYGVLGIVEKTRGLAIDYQSSVETVYREWAILRILRTRSLDVFNACADSGQTPGLPSWVPELRRGWAEDTALWKFVHSRRLNALMQVPPSKTGANWSREGLFPENDLRLVLAGSMIDDIVSLSKTGDCVSNLNDPTDLTTRLMEIVDDWEHWIRKDMPSNTSWCPADRKFLADREFLANPEFLTDREFLTALFRLSVVLSSERIVDLPISNYKVWRYSGNHLPAAQRKIWETRDRRAFEGQLFSLLHGCQMFITKRGNVGVVAGNCNARVGDQLYFLSGGLTPFILRKASGKHRLISPCFLSHHMTVYDVRSPSGNKLETVVLI